MWKLKNHLPPPSADRLALACLEGDSLWPLHPIGVLADLERPNEKGETMDFSDPSVWHTQLQQSHLTLLEPRARWTQIPETDFVHPKKSIFRTKEGFRLYQEWKSRWSLEDA
jgi:hypothetical protein